MKYIALFILACTVPSFASAYDNSCTTMGGYTRCSDGSSASRIGNTTYFNYAQPQYNSGYQQPRNFFEGIAQGIQRGREARRQQEQLRLQQQMMQQNGN